MSNELDELEKALAQSPPAAVATASQYPHALDAAWTYMGLMEITSDLAERWQVPHAHHDQLYDGWPNEPAMDKPGYCKVIMERLVEDVYVGRCEETGKLFWARCKIVG